MFISLPLVKAVLNPFGDQVGGSIYTSVCYVYRSSFILVAMVAGFSWRMQSLIEGLTLPESPRMVRLSQMDTETQKSCPLPTLGSALPYPE